MNWANCVLRTEFASYAQASGPVRLAMLERLWLMPTGAARRSTKLGTVNVRTPHGATNPRVGQVAGQ